jgi:TonB family protein
MTRLEKKCLVGAAGLHGLLLGIVLVGSAFQSAPPKTEVPILNIISANVLDRAGAGGGAPQISATQQPQPTPPKEQVAPPKVQEPTPEKPQKEVVKTETVPEPPKKVIKHHEPERDLTEPHPVESPTAKIHIAKPKKLRSADDIAADISHSTPIKTKRPQRAKHQADDEASTIAYNNSVKRALNKIGSEAAHTIGSKTSGLTVMPKLGEGGGSEAYAGYESVVGSIYYRAWIAPEGIGDGGSDTEVEIVVARDGSIVSAQLTTRSGRSSMDRSVQSVLNKVRKLPPFPEGASDSQRTFQIVFNLKAKHSAG